MLGGFVVGSKFPEQAQSRALQDRAQVRLHLQHLLQPQHLQNRKDRDKRLMGTEA